MKKYIKRVIICLILGGIVMLVGMLDAPVSYTDEIPAFTPLESMIGGTLFFGVLFFALSLIFVPTKD